jgi:ribosome biogenesis protein MAK21
VFAGNLLARQKALPKPDLANHTLMHFLDKFVYRNPKAEESKRGGSIMQPVLASGSASHIVASSKAAARQQPTVNASSFWNLKPEQVSAEDAFFHEYFARVGRPGEASRAKTKKAADEGQAVSDDETAGEEEIWDALVNSKPEIEGAEDEGDSDMDLDEYDYSDNDVGLDGHGAGEQMSDLESDDAGFEGIFDDSEGSEYEDGAVEGEEEEEEAGAEAAELGRKRRLNRKEMRSLPTFASADDYAEMLAAEDD